MKIVIDEDIPYIRGVFEPYATVLYKSGASIQPSDVRKAQALIVRTRTQCNTDLLTGSAIEIIASATIGYDHIDTDACKQLGISWTNSAGCNALAVSQYVWTAILHIAAQKHYQLNTQTIGVIGCGNVGSRIAKQAEILGMKVLINDPFIVNSSDISVSLKQISDQADYITIHTPLSFNGSHPTYHLIDADFLDKMKDGSVLISSARGEVVETQALIDLLSRNKITAVIDVWENEPNISSQLLDLAHFATPHIAGYSAQGKAKATEMVVQAVAKQLKIKDLENWCVELNPPTPSFLDLSSPSINNLQTALHAAYQQSYDIVNDTLNLRKQFGQFESLRKNYFYRHQPGAYQIKCEQISATEFLKLVQILQLN